MKEVEKLLEIKERTGYSYNELSKALGYSNGQKIYDIARGLKGVSGVFGKLIDYVHQGFSSKAPVYIKENNFIVRTQYPRFIAEQKDGNYKVVQWIDDPLDKKIDDFLK